MPATVVVGRRQQSCDACDRWQNHKFARQVIQISFVSYFEANIYLFIYLFIRMPRPMYSRKHAFTNYFEVSKTVFI